MSCSRQKRNLMCLNTAITMWRGACITCNPSLERHHWFWFLYEKSGLPLCGSSGVQVSHLCCTRDLLLAVPLAYWKGCNVAEAFRPVLTVEQRPDACPGCPWSLSLPNNPKSPLCPTTTVLHVSEGNFCWGCPSQCF